uniref:Telomeric repeat-binding factor 2-interacting protein 1 n=1 Tax=Labrus bergylta TaxID=56723 RepID=A0A3Q3GIH7_9LABR
MPSTQDVAKSISPVLFMSVDGEPMSFFLRPGPLKCELQPLITAGGGMLSSVQQPGAILLIDPKERGSITEASVCFLFRYVSAQYIHDCVEKDEQLNLEDYRLNPEGAPNQSAKPNGNKESSPGNLGGRSAYTSEEDSAILKFVSNHKSEVGGNRLWQEMEKQKVTGHSWQSMKYRYRIRLAKRHSEVVEEDTTMEDTDTAEGEIKVINLHPAAQTEAANATCKPHLFIFDSESQEEESQEEESQEEESQSVTVAPANQQLTDLVSVTKALLRTSGDFSAARDLLLTPGCISGPFWDRHDDDLLLSADPVVRQQLQGKYGEDDLAKRVVKKVHDDF